MYLISGDPELIGLVICVLNFFLMFLFLKEKDRVQVGRGREREGDTESEVGSKLRAVSTEPYAGLELTNHEIMT